MWDKMQKAMLKIRTGIQKLYRKWGQDCRSCAEDGNRNAKSCSEMRKRIQKPHRKEVTK